MKAKKIILASLAICGSFGMKAGGAADFADILRNITEYSADATFEVLLPSAADPVVYSVSLQSDAAPADTLAPCSYVIKWTAANSGGEFSGFSAYFDGNHYRYRNNRLQEYHTDVSVDPFMPNGPGSVGLGVQSTAQFADLLPQFLGEKISAMVADTSYIYQFHADTIVSGRRAVVVDGVKRNNGYDSMIFTYVFDHDTLLPVFSEIESSPASISEQIMTVVYSQPTAERIDYSEDALSEEWPEAFEKFRKSTFRAENLPGTPMPTFNCQILGSTERMSHHQAESLDAPSVFVFLDPAVASCGVTMQAVRDAVDMAPMDCRVYWVFTSNNADEIGASIGKLKSSEIALISANTLVRNCGITLYPTIVTVSRNGVVKDVIPGFNNDLGMVVLQKMMLL